MGVQLSPPHPGHASSYVVLLAMSPCIGKCFHGRKVKFFFPYQTYRSWHLRYLSPCLIDKMFYFSKQICQYMLNSLLILELWVKKFHKKFKLQYCQVTISKVMFFQKKKPRKRGQPIFPKIMLYNILNKTNSSCFFLFSFSPQ